MTRDILIGLGEANLAAAVAVIAVLALRRTARQLFGAGAAYSLWALVPAAMIATLLPARVTEAGAPIGIGGGAVAEALAATGAFIPDAAGAPWATLAFGLWLLGALGAAALLARQQARFLADVTNGAAGPAVLGFLRPRVITPPDFETRFGPAERALVLAHERVHLDRFDAQANALAALLRCVCWFNPLIHWGAHAMRLDQELACDAAVIARHPDARRRYAEALLKTQLAVRPLPIGCTWPAGTRHPLTERIAMLKRKLPSLPRRVAAGALVAALTAAAGITSWAAQPAVAQGADPEDPQAAVQSPRYGDDYTNAFGWEVDASAPVLLRGEVSTVEFAADEIALVVPGSDEQPTLNMSEDGRFIINIADEETGVAWRVSGAKHSGFTDEMLNQLSGQRVTIRAYQTIDKTCDPACRADGRDITFAEG